MGTTALWLTVLFLHWPALSKAESATSGSAPVTLLIYSHRASFKIADATGEITDFGDIGTFGTWLRSVIANIVLTNFD